jgi:hypothetical protein
MSKYTSPSRFTHIHDTFNELDVVLCESVEHLHNIIDGACLVRTKEKKERFVRVFRMACTRQDFVDRFNDMPSALYVHWMKYYTRMAKAAGVKYKVGKDRSIKIKLLKDYGKGVPL